MTVNQIHGIVRQHKPVSRTQLYNYFEALKIKPIGARQRPQRYPDDAPFRILIRLGFPRVVSLRTLKAARDHSANGRRMR
jgi:hypothetical protein